ncbi:MAG TPA: carboxypeptidase-like regulatory domain-containing protein, partial [Fibrobacteraceae bacterium]|nr:carboxypeptidase-like regulatory domain-containing protein [Fibrobacteraceae bacterium]
LDSTDLKGVNLIMKKPGTVFGSVVLPPEYRRAKVGIVGLDYFALTDSTGSFEFESLPADTFSIVALMESESSAFTQFASSSVAVVSGESTEINIGVNGKMDSVTVVDSLFYEDFEDSTKGWYTSAANYATADLRAVLEEDRDELVAYFSYTNDSTNGWALMGNSFDDVQDLSNLDSVSFMARGDGRVSLAFDHWDDVDSAFTDKAWIHIEISSSWTRYVVKPSDFLKADSIGGNTGWDSVKKAVTNITFFGNNGKEFWLDDIVLYSTKRVLKGIE